MAGLRSSGRRILKLWAKKFRVARAIYHASDRALNRQNLRILNGSPAFAPYGSGSYRLRADLTIQAAHQIFPFLTEFLRVAGREIIPVTGAQNFNSTEEGRAAASELKVLLDQYGSDKATNHNYHLIYGPIVARANAIHAILEVGLGTNNEDVASNMGYGGKPGASLRAFRDYLPRAQVFGADVDKRVLFKEERITTFFVDQTQLETVTALGRQLPAELDLIIDDGLHSPNANVAILMLAMTKLKEGGWVVIEDINPSALPIWQVVASIMPNNYECRMIDAEGGMIFAAKRTG
jgi:hypothetical protein